MADKNEDTTKVRRSGGRRVVDNEGNLLLRIPPTKPIKPAGRPGRPLKEPKPGTTVSLGLRIPAELKNMLDAAADDSSRSQSDEAARRLAGSFELQPIKEIMTIVNLTDGGRWNEEPAKAALVMDLVQTYLKSLLTERCRKALGADTETSKELKSVLEQLANLRRIAER